MLIELGSEKPAVVASDWFPQLGRQGRLADAGGAGKRTTLLSPAAALSHACEQPASLIVALVQPIGQRQLLGQIDEAKLEGSDRAVLLQPRLGLRKSASKRLGALVTRLGHLRQQPQNDVGKQPWYRRIGLRGGHGRPRQVRVDQVDGIVADEGRPAGQHLVEHDAERIEIGALIDQAVHAPGLFGGDVRKLGVEPRRHTRMCAASHAGGGLEVNQRGVSALVDHDVPGIDVAVDDAPLVQPDQRLGKLDGDGQEPLDRYVAAMEPFLQVLRAGILHGQRGATIHRAERDRPYDAGHIEAGEQVVLQPEPRDGGRIGRFRTNRLHDDRRPRFGGRARLTTYRLLRWISPANTGPSMESQATSINGTGPMTLSDNRTFFPPVRPQRDLIPRICRFVHSVGASTRSESTARDETRRADPSAPCPAASAGSPAVDGEEEVRAGLAKVISLAGFTRSRAGVGGTQSGDRSGDQETEIATPETTKARTLEDPRLCGLRAGGGKSGGGGGGLQSRVAPAGRVPDGQDVDLVFLVVHLEEQVIRRPGEEESADGASCDSR